MIFKVWQSQRFSVDRKPHGLLLKAALMVIAFHLAASSQALDLDHTLFDKAGHQYGLSPALLYAVALVESARDRGRGAVSPWPWALRGPQESYYAVSRQDALTALQRYRRQYGQAIDVGLMQINLRWHGKRVASPSQLLDPEQNLMLGAQLLAQAIRSSPQDFTLGIGRYHHWTDPSRARRYGQRVLTVLKEVHRFPDQREGDAP